MISGRPSCEARICTDAPSRLRRFDAGQRPAFEAFRTWGTGGGRTGAPCGDFDAPTVRVLEPQPGFVLMPAANLTIRATSDAPDLSRIWFCVEGPGAAALFADGAISLPGDGPLRERQWGGARDLQNGRHELLVYASDGNGNFGPVVEIPFAKGEPFAGSGAGDRGTGAGSLVRFPGVRLKGRGRRRTFSGGALPGITKGALRIEWQHKRGRRRKRLHAKSVMPRRPFKVTQKLRRAGWWRVRALYLGRPGIPRTASCWVVFHTKSAKTKTSCPRGAVRPG